MTEKQQSDAMQDFVGDAERSRPRLGLKWRIVGSLVGISVLLGIIGLGFVNYHIHRLMRDQLDRRALDIATNLGDGATPYLLKNSRLELHALVTKYALLSGIAYIAVRDGRGRAVTHSLGSSLSELEPTLPEKNPRESVQRELEFQGRRVFETHKPILGGQTGSVVVGVWADPLYAEVRWALFTLAAVLGILLLAAAVFCLLIVKKCVQPVIELKNIADKVSMGELETAVGIESNDEIGDLALSVDRLRSSLRAAMNRLEHAR